MMITIVLGSDYTVREFRLAGMALSTVLMAHSAAVDQTVESEAVWETVVSAVAEATGRDPLSLDPIYDAVNVDALDALVSGVGSEETLERLTFAYAGCDVTVTGNGEVRVEAADATARTGGVT